METFWSAERSGAVAGWIDGLQQQSAIGVFVGNVLASVRLFGTRSPSAFNRCEQSFSGLPA